MSPRTDFARAVELVAPQSRSLTALIAAAILGSGMLVPVGALACGPAPAAITENGPVVRAAPAQDNAMPQPVLVPHCIAKATPNVIATSQARQIGETDRPSVDRAGQGSESELTR